MHLIHNVSSQGWTKFASQGMTEFSPVRDNLSGAVSETMSLVEAGVTMHPGS